MAQNRNMCEEIQIAILSDEVLTEEQKNHIETCEECKALLSQTQEMKKDLGTLGIPGLVDGQITEAVMESVRKQKLSAPIPKFKITHHLGTAAAVAIILAAALMIKNPSADMSEMSVVDNTAKMSEVTEAKDEEPPKQHYIFASPEEMTEEAVEEEAIEEAYEENGVAMLQRSKEEASNEATAVTEAEEAPAAPEQQEPQTYKIRAVEDKRGQKHPEESAESSVEVPYIFDNGYSYSYDSRTTDGYAAAGILAEDYEADMYKSNDEQTAYADTETYNQAAADSSDEPAIHMQPEIETVVEESIEEAEAEAPMFAVPPPVSGGGSSSGDNSTPNTNSSVSFSPEQEATADTSEDREDTDDIFADITFLYGEENYDYNIALANARLSEIYGGKYMLTKELLATYGCTSNADFLSFIYSYAYSLS